VGTDIHQEAGRAGRELYATAHPEARVAFGRAAAEALPFTSGTFDIVLTRISLPYTHNASALDEMAPVLRPGGLLVLKIRHALFYLRQLTSALRVGDLQSFLSGSRVLGVGLLYQLTGRQAGTRLIGGETFQTRWPLRRELARRGLAIVRELPDSRATRSFCHSEGLTDQKTVNGRRDI
jgi:SAM-dependent methyltransferase